MPNDIKLFVQSALEKGASRNQIQDILTKAGWPQDEIQNALDQYLDVAFPVPVPRRKPYLSAREAFLYLLLFLTLYISAISFGTLIFQYVNRWLPDFTVDRYLSIESITNTIRWATASLVIAFPLYLWISKLLAKGIARDSEKRSSRVRKWLTYITLFIAAAVIIVDLITLIFNLLGGELTLRFVIKVATIGVIAGAIFGYYLWDLRGEEKESKV
ncbi:MAG: DUF5671 domain-containing protein [Patescibacteria group bacterium]